MKPQILFATILFLAPVNVSSQKPPIFRAGQFARVHRDGRWLVGVLEYSSQAQGPRRDTKHDSCLALDLHSSGFPGSLFIESDDSLEVFVAKSIIVVAPGPQGGSWVVVPLADRKTFTCSTPGRLTGA